MMDLSKSVVLFHYMIQLLSESIKSNKRISSDDFMRVSGLTRRSAQRYLDHLEVLGYLKSDNNNPKGYKATDTTKKLLETEV